MNWTAKYAGGVEYLLYASKAEASREPVFNFRRFKQNDDFQSPWDDEFPDGGGDGGGGGGGGDETDYGWDPEIGDVSDGTRLSLTGEERRALSEAQAIKNSGKVDSNPLEQFGGGVTFSDFVPPIAVPFSGVSGVQKSSDTAAELYAEKVIYDPSGVRDLIMEAISQNRPFA